jgi:hypothetical protein
MQVEQLGTAAGVVIDGPLLITQQVFGDARGFSYVSWNQRRFDEAVGESSSWLQNNHSRLSRGVQLLDNVQGGLVATVRWYLEHQGWSYEVRERGGFSDGRLGLAAQKGSPTICRQ